MVLVEVYRIKSPPRRGKSRPSQIQYLIHDAIEARRAAGLRIEVLKGKPLLVDESAIDKSGAYTPEVMKPKK